MMSLILYGDGRSLSSLPRCEQPFVERAQDLGDAGLRPHVVERGLEQCGDVAATARLRLLLRLARTRRAHETEHVVLAVDGRIFDVAVQLHEVLGEEDGDRDRRPALAVLLVRIGHHEIGVAPGRRRGQALAPHRLPVANEDAELEPAGLGQPREIWDVAPAVGRPVLGEHQDFRGTTRLSGEPLDGSPLIVGQPRVRVALEEVSAPVDARADQAEAAYVEALAAQVLGRAGELDVVVERHAAREAFGRHASTGPSRTTVTRWPPSARRADGGRRRSSTPGPT